MMLGYLIRYLYELNAHLDRFLVSASKAKINTPFPCETLRSILIQMTAASKCKNGSIKYWLSAGPGDFLLSPKGCAGPAFYAVVVAAAARSSSLHQPKEGVKAITTSVPMKHPFFAGTKSVNYLPNVLAAMEAEEQGAYSSVWVDEKGYVAEGPTMNVAFVTKCGELLLPAFDKILSGCTAKRLLTLAPKLVEAGLLKGARAARIPAAEARQCAEMMFLASGLPVLPVVEWDGQPVGGGIVEVQNYRQYCCLSELALDDAIDPLIHSFFS
jgi:4-amino-4-deoxychorismate lyase